MKIYTVIIASFLVILACSNSDDSSIPETILTDTMYFPPNNSSAWETKSVADLNWNSAAVQPLLDYLELKNTKSFIVLVNGRIVIEQYYGTHTVTSPWYWASAGKTLTTAMTGIAADQNILNLDDKVSDYSGSGWTSAAIEKENMITVRHLLSMTSGLNDQLNGDCVSPECLQFTADAGSRWAYHNVYVKLQDVVATASGESWNSYFNSHLKTKIGMTGAWVPHNNLSVYFSNTRSMARFGLLMLNNGKWKNDQIISEEFVNLATTTSQQINKSYGYLWWLNGKSSFKLPQSQMEFQGSLIPNAPNDMFMALGRDDQKIYVVPSRKIVVIRMGEAADNQNFALSDFDQVLWQKINAVIN